MNHQIRLPSPTLRALIHHYEFFEFGPTVPEDGHLSLPSFANGLLFFFYRDLPVLINNEQQKNKSLPSVGIVPPIIFPTHNYRARDLKAIRVIFQPGKFADIFDFPLKACRNSPNIISRKLERELRSIYQQLDDCQSPDRQIENIEGYLLKKLRFYTAGPSLLVYLNTLFRRNGYNQSVRSLAKEVGYSERHLNRLLNEKAGYSVSEFQKVHRLNRILEVFHRDEVISLTRLAHQMGYYDQSHFIREFKTLTHMTPRKYLKDIGHRVIATGTPTDFDHNGLLFATKKINQQK
jgi:AraC-like DNA-binding protein